MTELLDQKYRQQLATWIGKTSHFQLLYKISRDGCSAKTFHQKCNSKGETVTVFYNTNNTIYGGYLSQSWNSNGKNIIDPNAFLFRLQYNGSSNPLKFPISDTTYAGYGQSNYGPTFGDGFDIYSFSGNINKSGNYFPLNGSFNMGHSYTLNGQNVNSIANGHLQVTDLEVYQVKDGPDPNKSTEKAVGSALLDNPWRKFPEFNVEVVQQLKESIVDFEPENEAKLSAVNVLLIGQIGAGKSSFFNSVNSIFRGKITSKARSGSFEHSLTTVFRRYTIKDQNSGHNLKIRLCDTRGLEEDFTIDAQEIVYILDGNVPDRYQFNPSSPFTSETFGFIRNPRLGDKIHCVAFVVDGSTIDVMPQKILKQLKDLQGRMNQRNIPQVVYLTKLDKVCPKVNEDASNMFYSPAVRDTVNKVADVMGLPRGHILPIKNYENETSLDPNIDVLILKALKQTADFADDYLEEQVDKLAAEGRREEKD
ncbi:interferon-induced protein 44-like [Saccostrea echinata]|uniref:interferon-induced protein 44-like n=1 Tax=Saccostrea echinata TaxID=191078 RepID=UPI002A83BBC8|nr:interferon-induced protein 44-like [Saccostrea echinata]